MYNKFLKYCSINKWFWEIDKLFEREKQVIPS